MRVSLPYGTRPLSASVPDHAAIIGPLASPTAGKDALSLAREALDAPIAAPPLEEVARHAGRATLIISDATRADPRAALALATLERLPARCRIQLAIATGTHGPCNVADLGLPETVLARVERIINHDGADAACTRLVGTTTRGTPVRVSAAALEADLIILTGRILPHYFAGFGAGVKALFPGLGESRAVRVNHRLKRDPAARAGVVDGNPCREDLNEVLAMVPCPAYLLNVIAGPGSVLAGAVAGEVREAFRAGANTCYRLWRAQGESSKVVVASDRLPVTATLYQASKLVAAVAPLLAEGGTVILAAECGQGTGPVDVVNQGIYDIGLKPRLPADHRVVLVSSLPDAVVAETYCEPAPSVEAALAAAGEGPVAVVPEAAYMIFEVTDNHQGPGEVPA